MYTVIAASFQGTRNPRIITGAMGSADSTEYAKIVGGFAKSGCHQDTEFSVLAGIADSDILAPPDRLLRLYRPIHFGVLCKLEGIYQYFHIHGSCWRFLPRRLIRLGVAYRRRDSH